MSGFVARPSRLPTAVRLGLRDLRGGLRGFGTFIACIALGVAAIAGVGSFAHGLVDGLAREGRVILGADASFQVLHRELPDAIVAALAERGTVATMATTRAMARTPAVGDAAKSSLVEIKAVDPGLYPLVGTLESEPAASTRDALAPRNGRAGVLVEPALLVRLGVAVGDEVILGDLPVRIAGVIRSEPDRLAGGLGFGPRLLLSLDTFRQTGLIQPGSLIRWMYQLDLGSSQATDAELRRVIADIRGRFPDAGFEIRTRMNASPQLTTQIERFSQFLTLVGLTALLVGGVGVANAVASLVDRKRDDIATLKALGATGGMVFAATLTQVGLLALVGTAIGLAVGAALPSAVVAAFGSAIPIPVATSVQPGELATAAAYGLLVALAFALWPLGRAHDVPVSALFRDTVDGERRWPRPRYLALVAATLAVLVTLSVVTSFNPRLAMGFMAGAAGIFVALRLVAAGIMALAARMPRSRRTSLRLAVANLHRPGALTPSVVLSLGLGLTLLAVIALVDASFRRQIEDALPERAPSFFFVDIVNSDAPRFDAFIAENAPGADLNRVPMLRGRFVRLGGRPVEEIRASDDIAWALRGDRGITYAATVPRNSRVTSGDWWPADYDGPPLVSFDERMGRGFGLKLGDEVTVNVLGRNITARIANFRHIQWDNLGINFIVVFSPNTFRGAPHAHLATLTYRQPASAETEIALLQQVAAAFPAVTTVRVKDALEAVGQLATQIATGIRGASVVTLVAAILVLAGALAAGHRARVYDAVILKTLGAPRAMLIRTYATEYALLGTVTALFGLASGCVTAWVVATQVMNIPFAFAPLQALGIIVLAIVLTVGFGLVGTWRALGEKPAPVLRNM
ncbi:ABC transporter permease [Phreatobacter cathodiphilus]|uniref:Glycosyl transferase family 1 n=1 Tax=Phreatobacter cathodiphilus TaxID=1868589 RepID=A0A2S0NGA3_9HYPH|nr:FtsX-like permease family protein [Phreatobacter cathodiphilus]AVO47168.1 glycosyl transferase family 1 [Phreatobacter cathodiphilus]